MWSGLTSKYLIPRFEAKNDAKKRQKKEENMIGVIHARRTPQGVVFKVWCPESDMYYRTGEMTETEARKWLLNEELEEIQKEINARVQRALNTGTSSYREPRGLGDPWETEATDENYGKDDFNPYDDAD